MVLDESTLALGIDESEGMDTETLHVSERSGDGSVGKDPGLHSGRLGVEGHEIPGIVVGSLCLGDLFARVGLHGVDEVDKLDGIYLSAESWNIIRRLTLNEEDGDVVSD